LHIVTGRALEATIVRTAAGPVEVAVSGAGPAVLLVHGTPGSWRQLVPIGEALAAEHSVVLPSRPGYGRTPVATGRTPDEQAHAYAAVLDALAVERAVVVGVSGGGPSAAAFAARHPERTTGLVLCCALAIERFAVPTALRVALLPGLGELLAALSRWRRRRQLADPVVLERLVRRELAPAELEAFDDDMRVAVVRFLHSHLDAPAGLAGFRNDVAQVRTKAPGAASIHVPTLVLHGDADTVVPLAHGRAYAEAIAGATFEVVPGAGHGFLLTRASEIVPRLAAFTREPA
jgi:pimeloyl-ACP methyl ester carboxylesterase